mmetsp:Transcript_7693/g.15563  ORF Transcript_7693/g.15563 Transcript_7693/m.15563 type:complete len:259 (+) Transcript_7693:158-934(+)
MEAAWLFLTTNLTRFQLNAFLTIFVHEAMYWSVYAPFWAMDRARFRPWKIQPEVVNEGKSQWHCATTVLRSHLLLVAPLILFVHYFDLLGAAIELPLPSWRTVVVQVLVMMIIEDFLFYWIHRALHTSWLYKNVHSVHHLHSAPFGIAAEYAHPAETLILGSATVAGPLLLQPHLFTLVWYLFTRTFQTVECHSGYDFPWSVNRWLPLYGGADFHDHHHRHYSGNYASTFIWNDLLYGTDGAYRAWKYQKVMDAKRAD